MHTIRIGARRYRFNDKGSLNKMVRLSILHFGNAEQLEQKAKARGIEFELA